MLHPAQKFIFNWGIDGIWLEGTIGASNAGLNTTCYDGCNIDAVMTYDQLRALRNVGDDLPERCQFYPQGITPRV